MLFSAYTIIENPKRGIFYGACSVFFENMNFSFFLKFFNKKFLIWRVAQDFGSAAVEPKTLLGYVSHRFTRLPDRSSVQTKNVRVEYVHEVSFSKFTELQQICANILQIRFYDLQIIIPLVKNKFFDITFYVFLVVKCNVLF